MQRILPEINDLGAKLVAISPELPDNSLSWAETKALSFTLLSDQGNSYSRQCGLVFALTEELRPIYTAWGIDLPASNGDNTFELPLPATYVVSQDSHIILGFADPDYTKRLEPSEVIGALRALAASS